MTRCIEKIVDGKQAGKDLSEIHPGLRAVHCQHHYIFCLPRENAAALIVAILHERMDLMTRVAGRLK
ncbi:type II toxin-antitoxin system RelE/ParE family toxin [Sphingopyxis solisilvae]|uniref:type II toxin-antitoxin system RelE/ParE family toxin n=1 Tax=Sphingopyxis solisilvae TaxID=1886788 RepID=UPI001E3DF0C9|nr:type II toxin-antitoxin system RelE/ParE family toxin [Sphingopyxis solisilvae]